MNDGYEKASDEAGWKLWDYRGTGQWPEKWPPIPLRRLDDGRIYFEITPPVDTANIMGGLHGGFLATYAEHVAGAFVQYFDLPFQTVTVSLSLDYPAGGKTGLPLEGYVELVRETGRMQFVRLEIIQGGEAILLASAVLRKVPRG